MNLSKRIFDLAVAGTAVTVTAPIWAAVTLVLKATGEDVLFAQDRTGKGGVPFPVVKFTTMPKGSEKLGMLAASGDRRVTPFGALLRKTKINELPQMLNVFRGEMSVVGPRPLFADQVANYSQDVQAAIARVQPGVTGLGSLFFNAEDDLLATIQDKETFYNDVVLPQKGRIEKWYVENRTVWLDGEIVLRTALAVVTRRSMFPVRMDFLVRNFDAEVSRYRESALEDTPAPNQQPESEFSRTSGRPSAEA